MKDSRAFVISRKWMTTADIAAFQLVPQDGRPLPCAEPGSHVELQVDVPGGGAVVRQYSLCNAPNESDAYYIAVKLEPASRGGSRTIHALKEGETVHVGAARNLFPISSGATGHILVAAGIGITPLLAMAQHLRAKNQQFALHYFARGAEHVALKERLHSLKEEGRLTLHLGLDEHGVERELTELLSRRSPGSHLYHCGPSPFMDSVERLAAGRWEADAVHSERFQASTSAKDSTPESTFTVKLLRKGVSCEVEPGRSIAAALADAGYELDMSCEQGVCGTCMTKVVEGSPDHRDSYLSKSEREQGKLILPCVSRSRSRVLVLDL